MIATNGKTNQSSATRKRTSLLYSNKRSSVSSLGLGESFSLYSNSYKYDGGFSDAFEDSHFLKSVDKFQRQVEQRLQRQDVQQASSTPEDGQLIEACEIISELRPMVDKYMRRAHDSVTETSRVKRRCAELTERNMKYTEMELQIEMLSRENDHIRKQLKMAKDEYDIGGQNYSSYFTPDGTPKAEKLRVNDRNRPKISHDSSSMQKTSYPRFIMALIVAVVGALLLGPEGFNKRHL